MNRVFSRELLVLAAGAAALMFAIRMFETGFFTGQLSAKVYITAIGIIFLAVGGFTAVQVMGRKTVIEYVEKAPAPLVQPNALLTERESEVLDAIARGLTNKEIAALLFVSENTVKKHLNNIYFKLDVNRRTQAVARAKALKILAE